MLRLTLPRAQVAQVAQAVLRLCSGMLTLGSGKSGLCSRPKAKTELAKMRLESDFRGSLCFDIIPNWCSEVRSDGDGRGEYAISAVPA
jgi:hypothetical protein